MGHGITKMAPPLESMNVLSKQHCSQLTLCNIWRASGNCGGRKRHWRLGLSSVDHDKPQKLSWQSGHYFSGVESCYHNGVCGTLSGKGESPQSVGFILWGTVIILSNFHLFANPPSKYCVFIYQVCNLLWGTIGKLMERPKWEWLILMQCAKWINGNLPITLKHLLYKLNHSFGIINIRTKNSYFNASRARVPTLTEQKGEISTWMMRERSGRYMRLCFSLRY